MKALRNLQSLSQQDLHLITEALQEKVAREDLSRLPGVMKTNRERFALLIRLNCAKWRVERMQKLKEQQVLEFPEAGGASVTCSS
jgi:hypothetical protein